MCVCVCACVERFAWNSQKSARCLLLQWDHIDPSSLTVVSVPLDATGHNVVDFIAFPGRWAVGERTFKPPYFHRNYATEFNGIVKIDGACM